MVILGTYFNNKRQFRAVFPNVLAHGRPHKKAPNNYIEFDIIKNI